MKLNNAFHLLSPVYIEMKILLIYKKTKSKLFKSLSFPMVIFDELFHGVVRFELPEIITSRNIAHGLLRSRFYPRGYFRFYGNIL